MRGCRRGFDEAVRIALRRIITRHSQLSISPQSYLMLADRISDSPVRDAEDRIEVVRMAGESSVSAASAGGSTYTA